MDENETPTRRARRGKNRIYEPESMDGLLEGKTMSVRLPGVLRWRLERRAVLGRTSEGGIIKLALEAYLGPLEGQEASELKLVRRRMLHDVESALSGLAGPEPDGAAERPSRCPHCGNDFAFSALDDGTYKCGACRESGSWR